MCLHLIYSIKIFFLVLTDAGGPLELGDIEVHNLPYLNQGYVANNFYRFTVGLPRSSVCGMSLAQAHHHSGYGRKPLHGI